jgi:hypothetical protein
MGWCSAYSVICAIGSISCGLARRHSSGLVVELKPPGGGDRVQGLLIRCGNRVVVTIIQSLAPSAS